MLPTQQTKDKFSADMAELVSKAQNGNLELGKTFVMLDFFSKEIEKAKKILKDNAITELSQDTSNGKNEVSVLGSKITYSNGNKKYKYDHIPEIQALNEEIKWLEDHAKMAAIKGDSMAVFVDPKTGEQFEIPAAIIEYTKDFIKIIH